jgi:integrase
MFAEPKCERGRRVIDMPQTVGTALADTSAAGGWRRWSPGRAGRKTTASSVRRSARPLHPRSLITDFDDVLQRSGLPRIRFHDLRHSAATLMLVQGISPRVVMEILGHSEIRLRLETYSHVIPGLRREAADRMEATLRLAIDRSKEHHGGRDARDTGDR